MKKFTKVVSLVLSFALLALAFTSCALVKDADEVNAKKQTRETVLIINDDIKVSGGYYGWFFSLGLMQEQSKIQQDAQADSSIDSSAQAKIDIDAVKKLAQDGVVQNKLLAKKAVELNLDYSVSDVENYIESAKAQISSQASQIGISFKDYLELSYTSQDAFEEVMKDEFLGNLYLASLVSDKYVRAKHILIEGSDEEGAKRTKQEAKAEIEKIKADLDNGKDFEELVSLSEDPGSSTNPDGYTFGKGEMVPEFESAAFNLKVGEISGIVETSYGYHIIKKYETKVADIASAVTQTQDEEIINVIDAKAQEITKDVKVKETDKIKFYKVD